MTAVWMAWAAAPASRPSAPTMGAGGLDALSPALLAELGAVGHGV